MIEPYQGPRLRPLLRLGRHVRAVARSSSRPTAAARRHRHLRAGVATPPPGAWRKMNLAIRGIDGEHRAAQRRHLPRRPAQGPQGRLHPRQPAVQRQRLGRRPAARGRALEVRRAAGRQRQLRLGPAHGPPPGAARHRRLRARQRLDVSQPVGRGRHPQQLVEADLVDCMIALPGQLFYTTQIPVCLWFLARDKRKPTRGGRSSATAAARRFHRRPQAGRAGRPDAPGTDRRGDRPDRARLSRLARASPELRSTRTPGFCRGAGLDEIAGTATCSPPAATSARRPRRTMASRLSRGYVGSRRSWAVSSIELRGLST